MLKDAKNFQNKALTGRGDFQVAQLSHLSNVKGETKEPSFGAFYEE